MYQSVVIFASLVFKREGLWFNLDVICRCLNSACAYFMFIIIKCRCWSLVWALVSRILVDIKQV